MFLERFDLGACSVKDWWEGGGGGVKGCGPFVDADRFAWVGEFAGSSMGENRPLGGYTWGLDD